MAVELNDQYFTENFNTPLSPFQELSFQAWMERNNRPPEELIDYDLRGFWKDNQSFAENGHGSDMYKKPNHPTFSDESKYHNTEAPWGGVFEGGTWSEDKKGNVSYTPTATMLKYTHSLNDMHRYMKEYEPDVKLNLDRKK